MATHTPPHPFTAPTEFSPCDLPPSSSSDPAVIASFRKGGSRKIVIREASFRIADDAFLVELYTPRNGAYSGFQCETRRPALTVDEAQETIDTFAE